MADNPEFAKKLVDAIAARLDEKFGHRQGWMSEELDHLSERFDQMDRRFDRIDKRFNTLEHNVQLIGERMEIFERNTERRFDGI